MISHRKTKMASLASIVLPHKWDANLDRENVARIAESLRDHGQTSPIVVDLKGVLRNGRHRYAAAKSIGWKSRLLMSSGPLGLAGLHCTPIELNTFARIVTIGNRSFGV